MFTSLYHSEILRTPCVTLFKRGPRRLSIFSCVMKPGAVEGPFQNRKPGNFSQVWAQQYL